MKAGEAAARRRRSGPRSTTVRVLGIVALLLAVAAATGLPVAGRSALLPGVSVPWWVLAIVFAATEVFVLHVQVRRETRTITLSEIPLVIGLFLASPVALALGRIVGSVVMLVVHRRAPVLKTVFNVALFAAETFTAVAVFWWLDGLFGGSRPASWVAAYLAVLIANALTIAAVGWVIALYEGLPSWRSLLREALAQAEPVLAITLGLISVTCLEAWKGTAWLLAAFVGGLLLAFRSYAALTERHQKLERLYQFSQAVGHATEIDEVMTSVLGQARELLRSERASAAFVAASGELVARVRLWPGQGEGQSEGLVRSEDPASAADVALVQQVLDSGPVWMPRGTRDPVARAWLDQYGMRDAIAVPMSGAAGISAVLTVADRLGDVRTFEQDDVLLLETVAQQAAVALRNGELIGQLRHEALHDALTGLPNRVSLQRRVSSALEEMAAGRSPGAAVMILDLTDFKGVNDTLGHQQGDLLLAEVGARLAASVGRAGTVGRVGGDEFAVLVSGTDDEDQVMDLARRLLRALEQPTTLDGLEVETGAAIGVALAPTHTAESAELFKQADIAMHAAKASTHRVRLYEPELDTNSPRRLMLASELRTALQRGAIEVHLQPQARALTGVVVGCEALVRWHHPVFGWISPEEFIPVAERGGLIAPLTTHVLDTALAACARWRSAGHDLGIAVNLSTRSLLDTELAGMVAGLLRRHGVPAGLLTLEVTESSVMADVDRAVAVLHQLRDLGVRLSVDDFGTGYSSLSYLKRLPVQEVKIDRSFVAGLRQQGEDAAIVRAIIELATILELEVVAEGVEDQTTWDLLTAMGCDLVQGFHLARPMPIGDLRPWLAARAPGVPQALDRI